MVRFSVVIIAALTLLLACGDAAEGPTKAAPGKAGRAVITEAIIVGPKLGAVLGSPWTPVLARLPEGFELAVVSATLDGQSFVLPSPVIRRRMDAKGGGLDLLTAFDLDGMVTGEHELELVFELPDGRQVSTSRAFTYSPPAARVQATVTDGTGPVSARILVLDAEGKAVRSYPRDAHKADPGNRDKRFSSHFAVDGRAAFHLEPGRYTLVAVRSFLDHIDAQEVLLEAGTTELAFAVPPAVPLPGWIVADLHTHTGRSNDSYIPDLLRLRSYQCAGLDLVVVSDHNRVSDLAGALEAMPWFTPHLVTGVEARVGVDKAIGHVNAFPVSTEAELPAPGDDVGAFIDAYRAIEPGALLQLDHPRGIQFRIDEATSTKAHALFTHKGYKRRLAPGQGSNAWMTEAQPGSGTTPLDFDALEIINRFSYDVWLRVRRDWFALMNHGHFLTGTGNSDSHALLVGQVGVPINLVQVGEPGPEGLEAAFLDGVRQGRVLVSTGPVVRLTVTAGGQQAGPGELLSAPAATAHITVRAAPWVPVNQVRLVVDGEVVQLDKVVDAPRQPDGSLLLHRSWPLPAAAHDSWVLAEAGWPVGVKRRQAPRVPGLYAKIAHGAAPIGFTNPVILDRDGNGRFDPAPVAVEEPAPAPETSGGCLGG
jgi:hypothetical protein